MKPVVNWCLNAILHEQEDLGEKQRIVANLAVSAKNVHRNHRVLMCDGAARFDFGVFVWVKGDIEKRGYNRYAGLQGIMDLIGPAGP